MKRTKFLKRDLLLIFLVFTTFWSCQKDDFYENQSSIQQSSNVTFKRISYEKLKTNQKAMEKLGKFTLRNNSVKNNLSNTILQRTVYNEQLGIEIDTIGIVYIERGGYHTITLQAYQADEDDKKLKNLILNQEKDGSYSEYLLAYDLTDEELEKVENKEDVDLIGNTTIYRITSNYNPSGFPLNDPDCWEDVVIGQVAVPCASGLHMPGQLCDYAGGSGAAYVKNVTIRVISAGCGMGGGGGGSTGGSPGTGGGGSGGGTNPGTGSNPSNPNNPSEPGNTVNPQEPGFADQDGNPISTTPVKNPELLEPEDEEEDDCSSLNKLKETDKTNLLPIIQDMRTKTADKNEYYSVFKRSVNFEGDMVYENFGVQQGWEGSAGSMGGSVWYGQIHTHPKGGHAMFSWSDLNGLREIYIDTYQSNKQDVFVMIVCHNAGIYSIKISDWDKFQDKLDSDWNNPKLADKSDKDKRRYLDNMLGREYNKSNNLEKTFLQEFKDYGISLYKADDDNLTNWKKLELSNPNVTNPNVNSIPCN